MKLLVLTQNNILCIDEYVHLEMKMLLVVVVDIYEYERVSMN